MSDRELCITHLLEEFAKRDDFVLKEAQATAVVRCRGIYPDTESSADVGLIVVVAIITISAVLIIGGGLIMAARQRGW